MPNPFLPSWEYVPDIEPYVFEDRVYVYGSHDKFNGYAYCLNDYVGWSAPVDDLCNWKYEGVTYRAENIENNDDRDSCLYAPDVTIGYDGRYYLYFVDSRSSIVTVSVCDQPAGEFVFYGYVTYPDGVLLGEGMKDEPQFDPAVLCESDKVYLYTGFCSKGDATRSGAMVTVLDRDMLTVLVAPKIIAPSEPYGKGTSFEGHEFFEAPSIRKKNDVYYFIYSSIAMHELCYATSKSPVEGFVYGGVIISNCDLHIDTYKPAEKPMFYGGNNHGSIVEIHDEWYIFYHRHTNGTNYSRQGCMERITFSEDGTIPQVQMTSSGSELIFSHKGKYDAYLACNLFCNEESVYTDFTCAWMNNQFPKITQDGRDGDEENGFICNMKDGATAGFKYFSCKDISKITICTRGYAKGVFEVRTTWTGEVFGTIPIGFSNVWKTYILENVVINHHEEVFSLYFCYRGEGSASMKYFILE